MSVHHHQYVLGLRREDRGRWERRAPLAPQHVKQLVEKGIKVIVQPSSLRTFADRFYAEAGAIIQDDLSPCDTIIGVKQVPKELLIPNKTYMFFSHTIKAQPDNMEMLDTILQNNIRLIDYEGITDNENKRLVRFGKFAGYAGMIDTLHALGDRLLALRHSTPFLHLGYSYCYSSLDSAKSAVQAMGEEIQHYGLPPQLVPLTFVFTSEGHVSMGAQEIFKLLPHEMVTQQQMVDLVNHPDKASPFKVYGVVATAEQFSVPNDPNAKFDKVDYYKNPDKYHTNFAEKYAPYASVIMNCMYWDGRFPRLITIDQQRELVEQGRTRLIAVGDISCDRAGSIEFLMKTTSIDTPVFIYDPLTEECHDATTDQDYIYKDGVLFCAIDNFPTEFPKEATKWFGDHLVPLMEAIVRSDPTKPFSEQGTDLPPEVLRAVIACHGELTPKYQYIFDIRKKNESQFKHILILGAGHVAGPAIEYLTRNAQFYVTVADINLKQAQTLIGDRRNCKAVLLDAKNPASLEGLVGAHDVTVSLLPNTMNILVAKACALKKKHLVTASYITPEMRALHESAAQAQVTFLNEIGLDPGIDHLEARRVIDEVHEKGGKIRSFVSWCGGLPSPEASANPLGYKFSWSPRGVLNAATAPAKYLQDGHVVEIPGTQLWRHKQPVHLFPGFSLEGVPNRDSTKYAADYGIEHEVRTLFRGTLRYTGYGEIMEAVVDIGLLDASNQPHLAPDAPALTWNDAMRVLMRAKAGISTAHSLKNHLRAPAAFPSKGYDDDKIRRITEAFEWLGLFSDHKEVSKRGNYIDSFCDLLQEKLKYEKDERDMILLHHIFEIEWPDGREETRSSTLVAHGDKTWSAMARTVGLPVGCAVELLMRGAARIAKGVIGPMSPDIYRPILRDLAFEGVKFVERRTFKK